MRHRVVRGEVAEVVQIKEPRPRVAERLRASDRVIVDCLELLGLHVDVLVQLGVGLGLDVFAQVEQVLRAREDGLQKGEELLRPPELGLRVDHQLEAEGRLAGGGGAYAELSDEPTLQLAHDALEIDRLVGQLAAVRRVEHLLGGVQRRLCSAQWTVDVAQEEMQAARGGGAGGWGGEWEGMGRAHLVILREVDVGKRIERFEQGLRAGTAGCQHKQPLVALTLVALGPAGGPVTSVHDLLQRGNVRVVLSRRRRVHPQPRRDLTQQRIDETVAPGV